jgi:hypothetical protein
LDDGDRLSLFFFQSRGNQLALGLEPVLPIAAVLPAPALVELVRAPRDRLWIDAGERVSGSSTLR